MNRTYTSYTDTEWQNLEEGFYKYAVEAEFTNGVLSERIESNVIERIIDGVGEAGAGMLQLFPNPTSGLVTVNSAVLIKNLSVLDNSGRLLLVNEVDALNIKLHTRPETVKRRSLFYPYRNQRR